MLAVIRVIRLKRSGCVEVEVLVRKCAGIKQLEAKLTIEFGELEFAMALNVSC